MMQWSTARFAGQRFAAIADLLARLPAHTWPTCATLNRVFAAELEQLGIGFVPDRKTKIGHNVDGTIDVESIYEVRIFRSGEVPTREANLHDFLNAIIWVGFPRSKYELTKRLAQLQLARAEGQTRMPTARTRDHDRLALIDEGGLLVAGQCHWIFGHALLEHAYQGEFGVRAAVVDVAPHTLSTRAEVDESLATMLSSSDHLARTLRSGGGELIDDRLLASSATSLPQS